MSFEGVANSDGQDEQHTRYYENGTSYAEDAVELIGVGPHQYLILTAAGSAWFADGVEDSLLGLIAPAATCEWGVSSLSRSFLIAAVFLGMAVSGPIWGIASDKHGRRATCLAMAVLGIAMNVASALAPAYGALVSFRFVVGCVLGGSSPVTLALLLESVPRRWRGQFGVAVDVFWSFGAIWISGLGWAILPVATWRILTGLAGVPMVALLAILLWVGESPRYLSKRGEVDAAFRSLKRAARRNGVEPAKIPMPMRVAAQEGEFQEASALELIQGSNLRTTTLLSISMLAIGMSYYGSVFASAEVLFGSAEEEIDCLSHSSPNVGTTAYLGIFLTAFGELLGLVYSSLTIDKLGRRLSIGIGLITAAIALSLSTVSLSVPLPIPVLILALVLSRASATGAFSVGFTCGQHSLATFSSPLHAIFQ